MVGMSDAARIVGRGRRRWTRPCPAPSRARRRDPATTRTGACRCCSQGNDHDHRALLRAPGCRPRSAHRARQLTGTGPRPTSSVAARPRRPPRGARGVDRRVAGGRRRTAPGGARGALRRGLRPGRDRGRHHDRPGVGGSGGRGAPGSRPGGGRRAGGHDPPDPGDAADRGDARTGRASPAPVASWSRSPCRPSGCPPAGCAPATGSSPSTPRTRDAGRGVSACRRRRSRPPSCGSGPVDINGVTVVDVTTASAAGPALAVAAANGHVALVVEPSGG